MKTRLLIFSSILTLFVYVPGKSQTIISGVVNSYAKIISTDAPDRVTVISATDFKSGDTAMIVQMKGAEIDPSSNTIMNMNNAGRYEFLIIQNIAGNQIQFKSNTMHAYDAGEALQLVRVPSYKNAQVSNTLTCLPWNGSSGGILAFFVHDTLELKDNIDATAKGFRGGTKTTGSIVCYSSGKWNYFPAATDSAGMKGESNVKSSYPYTRGRGANANGGGGGNGFGSGGGGGAGFGPGGVGGQAGELCAPVLDLGGFPGEASKDYFSGKTADQCNRIFAGGGGGSGRILNETDAANGGNGGGIVFILANCIITNNHTIMANGESISVTASNMGGNGGGGGGGSVLLSIEKISGELNIEVQGGSGGNTEVCSGQGGGGGGGFVYFSGKSLPATINFEGGHPGMNISEQCYGSPGFSGGKGDSANYLNPVLNGFLFNQLNFPQKVCFGTIPPKISGSQPKGGNGSYTFTWQLKNKTTSDKWTTIPGAEASGYTPQALYDTTDFRRIVISHSALTNEVISDTSKSVTIEVIPEIKNNLITPSDTVVCSNRTMTIKGMPVSGGQTGKPGSYVWEASNDGATWSGTGVSDIDLTLETSQLLKYFRRNVTIGQCQTASNISHIDVLPLISNNIIGEAQVICSGMMPSKLSGTLPSGGSNTYHYKWLSGSDQSHFSQISPADTLPDFAPGKISSTTYFKRIVLSGFQNTCVDSGTTVKIKVLPKLENNTISGNQTICESSVPSTFSGNSPSGGDGIFTFQWEQSNDGDSWNSIPNAIGASLQYGNLNSSAFFRRLVFSGNNNCCRDTSLKIEVEVDPKIQNNVITGDQIICQGQIPRKLDQKGNSVTGGTGQYHFEWQHKQEESWFNNFNSDKTDYQPDECQTTTYYRRKIQSGSCTSFSDSVQIQVLPAISNNLLEGSPQVCANSIPGIIQGKVVSGGNSIFNYSWEDSTAGNSWSMIPGALSKDFSPGVLSEKTAFRRIVKSGECCVSTSPAFIIQVNPAPNILLKDADTAVCIGSEAVLNISVSSGTSPYFLSLTNGVDEIQQEILQQGLNIFKFIPASDGSYTIKSLADSKGCFALAKAGTAKIRLIKVPQANAGTTMEVCGSEVVLNATPDISSGKWISPVQATFVPSEQDPHAKMISSEYGRHKVIWKEMNETCWDTASVFVTFYKDPEFAEAGDSQELKYQFSTTLNAVSPSFGKGLWTSKNKDVIIKDDQSPSTEIEKLLIGKNVFTWAVSNGVCPVKIDTVVIEVKDLQTFSAFSPNNDGKNDRFRILGLENSTKRKLTVFNRWGEVVYTSENYNNDWDGNYKDEILPADTYFYVLESDNNKIYKGYFVLKH